MRNVAIVEREKKWQIDVANESNRLNIPHGVQAFRVSVEDNILMNNTRNILKSLEKRSVFSMLFWSSPNLNSRRNQFCCVNHSDMWCIICEIQKALQYFRSSTHRIMITEQELINHLLRQIFRTIFINCICLFNYLSSYMFIYLYLNSHVNLLNSGLLCCIYFALSIFNYHHSK